MGVAYLHAFVCETPYAALPSAVRRMAQRCLVDLAATGAAGLATPLSRIIRDHAVRGFGAGESPARPRGRATQRL